MATQIQARRGTTTQHSSFTGAAGELTVDTDKNTIVVHDGSTAGGHPLLLESDIDPDTVLTDTAPTFTVTVQTTERTITAGAFDLSTGNHWTCGAITVPAPTNAVAGTSGLIRITAGPVTWNSVFKFPAATAPSIGSFPAIIPFYVQNSTTILMGNIAEGIA